MLENNPRYDQFQLKLLMLIGDCCLPVRLTKWLTIIEEFEETFKLFENS